MAMDENYVDGPNGRNPARGGMIGVRGFGPPATFGGEARAGGRTAGADADRNVTGPGGPAGGERGGEPGEPSGRPEVAA